ncbi:DNA-binding protein [Streptomyces carminius]|uniref:DNA-binding protein n=1 Tax=Streptomyces carminius TaxID=2665496 RepID=A0A2M8M1R0_9ACTN|nr:helix-turn-helix domain-containing protein [Streptomyces carminius]PJE98136.1 DNA-binding protein [Streptomyces carminius]
MPTALDTLNALTETVRADLAAQARHTLPARLSTPRAQMAYLHRRLGHSTRAAAALLGVHPETVRRYLKGLRKHPPAAFAARLEQQVRARYRPRTTRRQADEAMTATGLRVHVTATFGFAGPTGSSDDPRERQLHADLTSAGTRALLAARDAADEDAALAVIARAIAEDYFQFRDSAMDATINDLVHIGFER